jgi:hypothetical protein
MSWVAQPRLQYCATRMFSVIRSYSMAQDLPRRMPVEDCVLSLSYDGTTYDDSRADDIHGPRQNSFDGEKQHDSHEKNQEVALQTISEGAS